MKAKMRKRLIFAITCMIMTLVFYGCGSGSSASSNMIQPFTTETEETTAIIGILSGDGYTGFVSYDVDETFQSVKIGIDYVKDGKLVKDEAEGTTGLGDEENKTKAEQGIAGFLFNNGTMTVGVSVSDGSYSSASGIELSDYSKEDDESISFVSFNESQQIIDGKKIYLGIISSSDATNTSVLTDSGDMKELKGKNWLPYVLFSTKPLE